MIVPDNLVPAEGKKPSQAFADNGRPDVPDMHLLGRIGGGIVNHRLFRFRAFGCVLESLEVVESLHPSQDEVGGKFEIYEPGPASEVSQSSEGGRLSMRA